MDAAVRGRAEPGARRSRRGFALPLTLVTLVLLTGLSLRLAELGSSIRAVHRRALADESLRAAAWCGIRRAALSLANDPTPSADSDFDDWAQPDILEHPSGIRVTLRTLDENRKVDLNLLAASRAQSPTAIEAMLGQVFRAVGLDQPFVLASRLRRAGELAPDGAPAAEGRGETRSGRPFHGWPHVREAVGLAAPWPEREDADTGLSPYESLTLLPPNREQPSKINLNTAPEPVLRALFGESRERETAALIALRKSGPLFSVSVLERFLPAAHLRRIGDLVSAHGTIFRITAVAEWEADRVEYAAWVRRNPDGTCSVIRWGRIP